VPAERREREFNNIVEFYSRLLTLGIFYCGCSGDGLNGPGTLYAALVPYLRTSMMDLQVGEIKH
jgi:hypothetical protein